jgi:Ser/Thr protein kinase RdoA (MazF antagonist)
MRTLNEMLTTLWHLGTRAAPAVYDVALLLVALRQGQDGTAPWMLPLHGYYLARCQTCAERAETLALLRQIRTQDTQHGVRLAMLDAAWN